MYDTDLPERFGEMSEERKKYLLNWIKENFIPRKTFNRRHSSYRLKHYIKEYYNNGEFKGAMKASGYEILDENTPNWIFNISQKSPALKGKLYG